MDLCKYKDILGKPGEGFHKARIGGLAAMDIVGTLALGAVLSYVFSVNLLVMILIVFLVGEFLHYVMCVDTPIIKKIKSIMK